MRISINSPYDVSHETVFTYTAPNNDCVIIITNEFGKTVSIGEGESIVIDQVGQYTFEEKSVKAGGQCGTGQCKCDGKLYATPVAGDQKTAQVVCSRTATPPATVYYTGYTDGPPELPEMYTAGVEGENVTALKTNIDPHEHPRFDAAGYYNELVYTISPNSNPAETLYLNEIDTFNGDNVNITKYTADDIVDYAGDTDQLSAKGATVIGNIMYFIVPSKFLSTIGRMVELNLDTKVATDIGEASLTLGIGDDLYTDGVNLYANDDGAVKQWNFGTNAFDATLFSFPAVGSGYTGAAYWYDGYHYAIAYSGAVPNRTYSLVKTIDGTSHEEFALSAIPGDTTITDAAIESYPEGHITAKASITCDGITVCCVDEAGNEVPCPPELDSLSDIQACIRSSTIVGSSAVPMYDIYQENVELLDAEFTEVNVTNISAVESSPTGLEPYGDGWLIVGGTQQKIIELDANFVPIGPPNEVSTASQNGNAVQGLTQDGTYIYTVNSLNFLVHRYTPFAYTDVVVDLATVPGVTVAGPLTDIRFRDNKFHVSSFTKDYVFDASWNYLETIDYLVTPSQPENSVQGFDFHEGQLFIVGGATKNIQVLNLDGTYTEQSFVTGMTLPRSIASKDGNLFVVDNTATDVVKEYTVALTYEQITLQNEIKQHDIVYGDGSIATVFTDLLGVPYEIQGVPSLSEMPIVPRSVSGSDTTPTTAFDDGPFPDVVEDYVIACTSGSITVVLPNGDTFTMLAGETEVRGEGTERDVKLNGLSVVGDAAGAKWRISVDI